MAERASDAECNSVHSPQAPQWLPPQRVAGHSRQVVHVTSHGGSERACCHDDIQQGNGPSFNLGLVKPSTPATMLRSTRQMLRTKGVMGVMSPRPTVVSWGREGTGRHVNQQDNKWGSDRQPGVRQMACIAEYSPGCFLPRRDR